MRTNWCAFHAHDCPNFHYYFDFDHDDDDVIVDDDGGRCRMQTTHKLVSNFSILFIVLWAAANSNVPEIVWTPHCLPAYALGALAPFSFSTKNRTLTSKIQIHAKLYFISHIILESRLMHKYICILHSNYKSYFGFLTTINCATFTKIEI